MKAHVQVESPTKALDDGHRACAAISMPRCFGPLPVEAEQGACVHCKHRAAERVIPGQSIAKLEGKAQHPLPKRGPREHVVDEMCRALGHPAAAAARAKASALARERNQPIGATTRTAKPGKPMREHAASDEAVKHPTLRRATHG